MAKKNEQAKNYKTALNDLEEILSKLQKEETSIDELVQEVDKAQKLVKFCKGVLRTTEDDLEKILE